MQIEKISDTYHRITFSDGSQLFLVGTAHVSSSSVDQVRAAIEEEDPDTICIELDSGRLQSKQSSWQNQDIRKVFKEKKGFLLLANTALASFQKRLGAQTGISPGDELLGAVSLAKEKGLYVGEAIWTRYMPSRYMIDSIIKEGKIGRVTSMCASLGYKISHKPRIVDPRLAGGALLDIGIYPLNFVLMAAGDAMLSGMAGLCRKSEEGVDLADTISLTFNNGVTASVYADTEAVTSKSGWIYGTEGSIEVYNVNNPERISIYSADRTPVLRETIDIKHEINGYEYELRVAKDAIEHGRTEPDAMPWSETLRVMRLMDTFRRVWGIKLASELDG